MPDGKHWQVVVEGSVGITWISLDKLLTKCSRLLRSIATKEYNPTITSKHCQLSDKASFGANRTGQIDLETSVIDNPRC